MQKMIVSMLSVLFLFFLSLSGTSQKKMAGEKNMNWTTKSKAARELALQGADHYMNIELPQAYEDFTAALKLDPDFIIPLAFMAVMTKDDAHKDYVQRAIRSAANKTEGEKLFVSILDEKNTPETRREAWTKLHDMFQDDRMISHFYVTSRATPEERLAAAEEYLKKFPDQASMYNTIAYYYLTDKKDNAMAKKHFEKYIELYPNGINPYDSMGEFYMLTGDMENAEKFYKKAVEKYPFNNSSLEALGKINEAKKKTTTSSN